MPSRPRKARNLLPYKATPKLRLPVTEGSQVKCVLLSFQPYTLYIVKQNNVSPWISGGKSMQAFYLSKSSNTQCGSTCECPTFKMLLIYNLRTLSCNFEFKLRKCLASLNLKKFSTDKVNNFLQRM